MAVYGGAEFGKADIDTTSSTIGAKGDVTALNVGGDAVVAPGLRLGGLFGYSENKGNFGSSSCNFKMNETTLTGYAAYNPGPWYVGRSLGAGGLDFKSINRNIELGPTVRTEHGTTKGNHIVARGVIGMNMSAGVVTHGPIASLTWRQIKVNGYAEDGANSTTMIFTEQTRKSLLSSRGYGVSAQLGSPGGVALVPWLRVMWETEHSNDNREVRAGLVTMAGSFALPAYRVDDNYGKVDAGVAARFSPTVSGYVNYPSTLSQANQKTNAVLVGVRIAM